MENGQYRLRTLAQTEVIVGSNLIPQIVPSFNHRFQEGALCVIYDRGVTALAEDIIRELKGAGYRLFVQAVSSARHGEEKIERVVPEYVRHVFAVGAGTASAHAKAKAKELGIDWTLFLTAPSTDTIMCGYAPTMVFIDENVLLDCPFECVASGYGLLFSQSLTAFEASFSHKVLALSEGEVSVPANMNMKYSELAYALLEMSLRKRDDSAQLMSEILYARALREGKKPRLIGEYKFLASAVISAFYSVYLAAPSIDVIPPACRELASDELDSLCLERKRCKSVDFFDLNGYFRISYILSEYRTDLLDKLGSIDFHTSQRFWRRLYPDAGYWLKGEITCKDLTDSLKLAGARSENLLGFAYASGVLSGI